MKCTGVGIKHLQANKALKKLGLGGEGIGDAAMREVKGITGLRYLSLQFSAVSDLGLRELKGLPNLEHITLSGNRTTEAGQAELRQALPKLEIQTSVATDEF
jgi:Leucine-rich repeat (LRR) protein